MGDISSMELSAKWGHIPTSEYGRNLIEGNYWGSSTRRFG